MHAIHMWRVDVLITNSFQIQVDCSDCFTVSVQSKWKQEHIYDFKGMIKKKKKRKIIKLQNM